MRAPSLEGSKARLNGALMAVTASSVSLWSSEEVLQMDVQFSLCQTKVGISVLRRQVEHRSDQKPELPRSR